MLYIFASMPFMLRGALFIFLLFSAGSIASVRVAFFEKYDSKGNLIQLEKNGRFFHVAIEVAGHWLHTDSYRGVELVVEVPSTYGERVVVLENRSLEAPSFAAIESYLGIAYDKDYLWDNNRLYCSELVSKLLDLEPRPMRFDGSYWKGRDPSDLPNGKLGSSPDLIYRQLLKLGWRPFNCDAWL